MVVSFSLMLARWPCVSGVGWGRKDALRVCITSKKLFSKISKATFLSKISVHYSLFLGGFKIFGRFAKLPHKAFVAFWLECFTGVASKQNKGLVELV